MDSWTLLLTKTTIIPIPIPIPCFSNISSSHKNNVINMQGKLVALS
jgi:hypothetical protein